jgi:hypothetical protein
MIAPQREFISFGSTVHRGRDRLRYIIVGSNNVQRAPDQRKRGQKGEHMATIALATQKGGFVLYEPPFNIL